MILKIFKGVWFLSLLLLLAIFMYVYASLPQEVILNEGVEAYKISRGATFYILILLIAVVNSLVFIVGRLYGPEKTEFKSWFYGIIISLNLFFIAIMAYLNVVNSGEKYDYIRLGILLNSSIGIIVLWIAGWPLYHFSRRLFSKQSV